MSGEEIEFQVVGPIGEATADGSPLGRTGMREPTHDECSTHAEVEADGRRGFAAWYPQMGGYVSHCIIIPGDGCFDVYVWHDGDFPFADDLDGGPPRELHHCDADQFIQFGELANRLMDTVYDTTSEVDPPTR